MYNLCFNERQNIWVTRYDWIPVVSENINDNFYSLNVDLSEEKPFKYKIWHHSNEVGKSGHVSNWYNGQQGFEFEFVVSDPIGINKIFDNLQIVSNNVQPNELEITIIGDDYEFKRELVACADSRNIRLEIANSEPEQVTTTSDIHENRTTPSNINISYKWDWRLHQNAIIKVQKLLDIYKVGRRLGNIQYKDGSWFIQIEPIRKDVGIPVEKKEIRVRDKWAKIRIKYSGKDLAIIAAIKTLINV